MKIRDRIKELRRVPASELIPNPKNWRTHSKQQQDALKGILAEVGIAGAVLARETPDGLMLIDGHMRAVTDPGAIWPVLVLDVNEAEADKILATYDPIAAMADADALKLDALLRDLDVGNESIQTLLADLAADAGLYKELDKLAGETAEDSADPADDDIAEEEQAAETTVAGMYQVAVECVDEEEQQRVYELMTQEGYTCRLLKL